MCNTFILDTSKYIVLFLGNRLKTPVLLASPGMG